MDFAKYMYIYIPKKAHVDERGGGDRPVNQPPIG